MSILKEIKLALAARKLIKEINMATVSDDKGLALGSAARVNAMAAAGEVLVTVAQSPTVAAAVSTASTTVAGAVAGTVGLLVGTLVPGIGTPVVTAATGLLAIALNYLFSWLRKRHELATTPGAQAAPAVPDKIAPKNNPADFQ